MPRGAPPRAEPAQCRFFCLFASSVCAFAQVAPDAAKPIPDPSVLLEEAKANQHKLDEIRENYTFHVIRRTDDLDKNGAVVKTTTIEREVFVVNGLRIGRMVKRDGKELTPSENKAVQARVQKVVETALKEGPRPRRAPSRMGEITDILAVVKISNPRRVLLRGRESLAYDFTGDSKAHSIDLEQSAAKKMSGTLWFDEADRQVARLEVRFDANFHFGGGLLANVEKGTSMEMDQSPVGDGLWMQTSSAEHMDARFVTKKIREDVHVEDFDFKKFNVATVQQVLPPAR
jgi:hypothetical protein